MIEYVTYEKIESTYRRNDYTRKCINGKKVGCSNCVGYCMYQEHEGYLTKELRKEHDCINKQCKHYVAKLAKERSNSQNKTFSEIMDDMKKSKTRFCIWFVVLLLNMKV